MLNLSLVKRNRLLTILFIVVLSQGCRKAPDTGTGFSFAYLTDIHIQPELRATEGFKAAIAKVNLLKPDFVITGGDLVMDVLAQNQVRADSLYTLYEETIKDFTMPVYNTIGNHEVFGYYPESGVDSSHPLYGDKMYEERLGKRYYVFEFNGWRFYILDSVDEWEEGGYYGYIDEEQMAWLKEDLSGADPETPLALSVHIPLLTVQTQIREGSTAPNSRGSVITNSREVLELFQEHNLKLVLQGHLHAYEDIYVNGTHFITGGAVSGRWWSGPRFGMEEGFLMVHVSGDEITTEYIDYGWQAGE
jgi:3',5'-cyclic AMP phosphodiesterase CpdA